MITIEDAAELQLQQPHVGAPGDAAAQHRGPWRDTQRDLVRNALRMRPDRIIVGECRGEEAFDMLQAMNTGHEGSMTTVHANTPRDALSRLEQMIGMAGMPMSVQSIRSQIAAAIDVDRAAPAPQRRQAQGDQRRRRSPAWRATSSRCRRSSSSRELGHRRTEQGEGTVSRNRHASALPASTLPNWVFNCRATFSIRPDLWRRLLR